MQISSYLIHCEALRHRLPTALKALNECQLEPHVIKTNDGNNLNENISFANSRQIWQDQISKIKYSLIANALKEDEYGATPIEREKKARLLFQNSPDFFESIPWMEFRQLKKGEISVLLKHYHAISAIANQQNEYGLIAEDDIICHDKTSTMFGGLLATLCREKLDYVDLAGGCGLVPPKHQNNLHRKNNLFSLDRPRTRTNACYIISKKLSTEIANRFMPFVMPIDWHLQQLFNTLSFEARSAWCIDPIVIHGSESGAVKSWRETGV